MQVKQSDCSEVISTIKVRQWAEVVPNALADSGQRATNATWRSCGITIPITGPTRAGEARLWRVRVHRMVSPHATPRMAFSAREPADENSQPNAAQFRTTVLQKITRKDCFFDL